MSILVTGGAGYIGSVVVDQLRARGEQVVVVDDLSRGFRDSVDEDVPLVQGPVGDPGLIREVVAEYGVDACVHLAGLIAVGESVENPVLYWQRNVVESLSLFDTLAASGVEHAVFSSSAAVYGNPVEVPIPETHPLRPTSPYGNTKLAVELVLEDLAAAGKLRAVALRYFNAAGATDRRRERHDPETHLIPLVLRAAATNSEIKVFGNDYPTEDGTAVRDYIHVDDLVSAHVLAIDYLRDGGGPVALNLGVGHGASVREVIATAEDVTGRSIEAVDSPRRAGDPAVLVAAATRAREALGWAPTKTNLAGIIESAWRWFDPR
jgi:UDP-glucose-4-epimerase GalE